MKEFFLKGGLHSSKIYHKIQQKKPMKMFQTTEDFRDTTPQCRTQSQTGSCVAEQCHKGRYKSAEKRALLRSLSCNCSVAVGCVRE